METKLTNAEVLAALIEEYRKRVADKNDTIFANGETIEDRVGNLEEAYEEQDRTIEDLRSKVESIEENLPEDHKHDINDLETEVRDLQESLSLSDQTIHDLSLHIKNTDEVILELKAEVTTLHALVDRLNDALTGLLGPLADLPAPVSSNPPVKPKAKSRTSKNKKR